jgi:hypothetical protein
MTRPLSLLQLVASLGLTATATTARAATEPPATADVP